MQEFRRSSRDIRRESRLDVLHALLPAETSTRAEVARATGLSVATVATLVSELLAEGVVVEAGLDGSGAGRPTTLLRIDEARGALLSVEVGEGFARAVAFDAAIGELSSAEVDVDGALTVEHVATAVVEAARAALGKAGLAESSVLGVGVALPGHVHGGGRRDVVEPHRGWDSTELIERVRAQTDMPIVADNPLKAIGAAELWFGRGPSADSMVVANLGTGVGAGIVVGGKLLRGAGNRAGEWGHSLLVLDGRECACGRRGCVEAYLGEPGIRETLREVAPGHPLAGHSASGFSEALGAALADGPDEVLGAALAHGPDEALGAALAHGPDEVLGAALAHGPDEALAEVVERTARLLGYALADLVAIVDPQLLVLTGCTAWALGEHLLPAVSRHLADRAPAGALDGVTLEVSTVRGNAVAVGMATLAFEAFVGAPT
ncbi:MAG: ROK family transcriptional regulator [Arachnia sp.]